MVNNSKSDTGSDTSHTGRSRRAIWRAAIAAVCLVSTAPLARASDQMYFPAVDNVTNVLVQYINQETVRIDMSAWYLTEHSISIALANRFAAGVPVRLIGDRGSIFEIDPHTKTEFYWLANQGIPIRLRYNPTWYPEIDHWKTTIFAGQNVVEFGSANYTPFQLAPTSSSNFDDETALVTDDPVLVGAFKTKFDTIWNDTAVESESVISGPPYFKNWYDACALESGCSDFSTQYPNPAPMNINTARLEPDNPMPADLIWGQGPDFNNRLVTEINNESNEIDFVIYRLTVDNVTQALLAKKQAGVPIKVIVEPNEYLNSKWPEFWLSHANEDKLWAAGIPMLQRTHEGITHMKMLVTSNYATNASSNFAAHWERDQDYFVPAATKASVYSAMKNRFQIMWNDTTNFAPFTPQPANPATQVSPASGATGVQASGATLTWDLAAFATSYDIYLGTSPSSMAKVGNVPAQLTDNPPATYSFTTGSLAGNTTYYWQVVSRTFATDVNPSISSSSSTWGFTTGAGGGGGGGGGGALPSPWVDQDVGSVGLAGNASYSSGTFSVSGAGSDIWGTADSFNYVSQSLSGDGQIVARVTGEQNTSSFAKAGVMFRESATASATSVILDVRPDGSVEFMTRPSNGAATTFIAAGSQAFPAWLKLARSGSTFTASVSADGSTWSAIGSTSVSMASGATIGLAVTSHNTSALNTASFDNVSVTGGSGGGGGGGGSLPAPWTSSDIGSTGLAGSASASSGTFTVKGAGSDIWGSSDSFQYVSQPLSGDGQIVARVTGEQNTSSFAKAGVMLRGSLSASDADVILDIRPDGSVEFMSRPASGGSTNFIAGSSEAFPGWLKLARSGGTVTGSISTDGSTWTTVGSTSVTMGTNALIGLAVTSHATTTLNTATFDNVTVTAGSGGGGGGGGATNVVIYANDITSVNGAWSKTSDSTAAAGVKLVTPDNGATQLNNPLAAPADFVDVTFSANGGTPYTLWLRVQALNNLKSNDSLWAQFSDAQVNGSAVYPIGSTSGLLVNLATDSTGSSDQAWGWVNGAYWMTQVATVTFPTTGTHTLRIQMREDGVQFDQIVLSPTSYLNPSASCPNTCSGAPGPVSNDHTIVPKS